MIKHLAMAGLLFVGAAACEDGLNVTNPNEPTPDVVTTEEGLKRVARGIYNSPGGFFEWIVWNYHETMGDAVSVPWSNYNWSNMWFAATSITANGTTYTPVASSTTGRTQSEWVEFVNDRQNSQGAVEYEWISMYGINAEANLMLQSLDNGISWVGAPANHATKEAGYRAWAHFWKGYAYHRIGLMYEQGLIIDDYGTTNRDYKTPDEMLAEAQAQFDLALANSAGIDLIIDDLQPSIFDTDISTASFRQAVYTLKARTLLSGSYRDELTNAEWTQIRDWAAQGLTSNDGTILVDSDEATFLATITARWRLATRIWANPTMRTMQAFHRNPGDQRLARFTNTVGNGNYLNRPVTQHVNTNWSAGPPYASANPGEAPQLYVSAEENELILAEAKLALGDIPGAAGHVNNARTLSGAGLAPVLTVTLEDIRWERRAALFFRGLAFYDARRFKEILPVAQGGGVNGVWVLEYVAGRTPALQLDQNASIEFNYRPYWPIPDVETVFNGPDASQGPGN